MKTITNPTYEAPIVTAEQAAEERNVLQTALLDYAAARDKANLPYFAAIARKLAEGFKS